MAEDVSIMLGVVFIWFVTITVPQLLGKQGPDWMLRRLTPLQRRGVLFAAIIGGLALMGFSGAWSGA